jgi:hypothetical protein
MPRVKPVDVGSATGAEAGAFVSALLNGLPPVGSGIIETGSTPEHAQEWLPPKYYLRA